MPLGAGAKIVANSEGIAFLDQKTRAPHQEVVVCARRLGRQIGAVLPPLGERLNVVNVNEQFAVFITKCPSAPLVSKALCRPVGQCADRDASCDGCVNSREQPKKVTRKR